MPEEHKVKLFKLNQIGEPINLIETPGGLETFGLNQSKEVDYLAKTRERAEKTAEEFGKKRLKEYRE